MAGDAGGAAPAHAGWLASTCNSIRFMPAIAAAGSRACPWSSAPPAGPGPRGRETPRTEQGRRRQSRSAARPRQNQPLQQDAEPPPVVRRGVDLGRHRRPRHDPHIRRRRRQRETIDRTIHRRGDHRPVIGADRERGIAADGEPQRMGALQQPPAQIIHRPTRRRRRRQRCRARVQHQHAAGIAEDRPIADVPVTLRGQAPRQQRRGSSSSIWKYAATSNASAVPPSPRSPTPGRQRGGRRTPAPAPARPGFPAAAAHCRSRRGESAPGSPTRAAGPARIDATMPDPSDRLMFASGGQHPHPHRERLHRHLAALRHDPGTAQEARRIRTAPYHLAPAIHFAVVRHGRIPRCHLNARSAAGSHKPAIGAVTPR